MPRKKGPDKTLREVRCPAGHVTVFRASSVPRKGTIYFCFRCDDWVHWYG